MASPSVDPNQFVLSTQGITKTFGELIANQDISLNLVSGRVHALLGENGAGKSTLVAMLYGLLKPDQGTILYQGAPLVLRSPADALQHGIGLVQQHFSLIPSFTGLENIILGQEETHYGAINHIKSKNKIKKLCDQYHFDIPLDQPVQDLPTGLQQQVEIVKVLYRSPKFILFDEPTASLVTHEINHFIQTVKTLTQENIAVLFITHRLPEVMRCADDITVLRQGKIVLQTECAQVDQPTIAQAIIGEALPEERYQPASTSKVIFSMTPKQSIDIKNEILNNTSLVLHQNEIFGIAGVAGNGQEALIDSILGIQRPKALKICFRDEDISALSLLQRRQKGIAYIPQDRIKQGYLLDHTIQENYLLNTSAFQTNTFGWIDTSRLKQKINHAIKTFHIKVSNPNNRGKQLSGGHQQRVVLSRELLNNPKLIIAHDPVRGLDLRAARFFHETLIAQSKQGTSILLFSSEWSELFLLCHRIAVLYRGALVEVRQTEDWTVEDLSARMIGA